MAFRLHAAVSQRMPILWVGLMGLVPAAWLVASFMGCSELQPLDGARQGKAGESCLKADDCEPPLPCLANVCGGSNDGGLDFDAKGDGPSANAGPHNACDQCLEQSCGAEEKACGPECVAIEACIEMLCANLSLVGSPDEGKCQTMCQNAHSAGKIQHLDVVNCALDAPCAPPCTPYPQDYEQCRTFMDDGDCAGWRAACEASPACNAYKDCLALCSSLAECLACDDTAQGLEGRNLLEAHERCIASECIAESWIP